MTSIFLFLAGIGAFGGWWLAKQRLTARPWLEEGAAGEFPGTEALSIPAAKIGLGIFLAVVGALFALFISAYLMRMQLVDWHAAPKPALLWINTGVLMASSAALQWARAAAERDDVAGARTALLATGGTAGLFISGQLLAWRQLNDAGFGLTAGPASSFFYVITALHGLHVLGGIVALGRTIHGARPGANPERLRMAVGLCGTYWDFLLLMWIILFCMLLMT
jgi:cytochrome c oxidase subunit 3